jgi:hypothetical protein
VNGELLALCDALQVSGVQRIRDFALMRLVHRAWQVGRVGAIPSSIEERPIIVGTCAMWSLPGYMPKEDISQDFFTNCEDENLTIWACADFPLEIRMSLPVFRFRKT